MNGLDVIHSQNEQAVIHEHQRKCQNILATGGSYITRKDSVTGAVDHTSPVVSFETAAQLKAHALASIKVSDINAYHLVYGRN